MFRPNAQAYFMVAMASITISMPAEAQSWNTECSPFGSSINCTTTREPSQAEEMVGAYMLGKMLGQIFSGGGSEKSKEEDIQSALSETAREMNKSLPIQIDNDTLLYAASAGKNSLYYHYKLSFDPGDPKEFRNFLETQILPKSCADGWARSSIKDYGINIIYQYSTPTGANYELTASRYSCGL